MIECYNSNIVAILGTNCNTKPQYPLAERHNLKKNYIFQCYYKNHNRYPSS